VTQTDERRGEWERLLTGPLDTLETRLWKRLPSDPRCLVCNSPYGRPFGPLMRLIGYGRSARYPQMCRPCFRHLEKSPGGAEVTLTVLFTDVRGSTAIAETTSPGAFRLLLEAFYAQVTEAVGAEKGIIDKFLGDGVMALFVPSFAGGMDAAHGVAAARRILAGAELPVGVGVNTGSAFTGFLGPSAEVASFTAVGDAVNVAHRLGEAAAAGELLIAAATAAAGLDGDETAEAWERRSLAVKGREQPVEAWSLRTTR
jgi:adenylate cyclase